jgi:hypothetical protein
MQTLLDGVESKLELKIKHESELERGFLSVFAHPGAPSHLQIHRM